MSTNFKYMQQNQKSKIGKSRNQLQQTIIPWYSNASINYIAIQEKKKNPHGVAEVVE